jgi:hypothetical protein
MWLKQAIHAHHHETNAERDYTMSNAHFPLMTAVLAMVGGLLLPSYSASATSFCPLKPTQDGFVALRSGPSPSARLIGRMKADDEVQLGESRKGDWIQVTWWRGEDRLARGYDKVAGRGWVHRRLVAEECG